MNGNIIHVKHISDSPTSSFYKAAESSHFMSEIGPIDYEKIIEKKNASSFYQTDLNEILRKEKITNLFLMGFTANECIEATARDASELGFSVHVIGDATAMFDFMGHDKTLYKAEKVHSLILANIHQLYAKVIDTEQMITIPSNSFLNIDQLFILNINILRNIY
jgi:nicotinamidase-related amidase